MSTGELIGLEYLYSQTNKPFEENYAADPDIPDGIQAEDLEADLEGDEGFEDLDLDCEPLEIVELSFNPPVPIQQQAVALQPPGLSSSKIAESSFPGPMGADPANQSQVT